MINVKMLMCGCEERWFNLVYKSVDSTLWLEFSYMCIVLCIEQLPITEKSYVMLSMKSVDCCFLKV